ncbi:MAG: hypothetical protein C5B52_06315 [Bacteroidetes bacterium]|nr:MAG: hypothetical protein C5B52_06315 [Bacteroidota bacterium]
MDKITPCLWFDGNGEEAMNYYVSIFKNSKIKSISQYGDIGPGKKGSLLTGVFELEGRDFMVLNGGPMYKFTPAISLSVDVKTQEELDYYWDKLSSGGDIQMCGWLVDKYGVSWQIVPSKMGEYITDKDPQKTKRVMEAMMQMKKLDIKKLQDAYDGK